MKLRIDTRSPRSHLATKREKIPNPISHELPFSFFYWRTHPNSHHKHHIRPSSNHQPFPRTLYPSQSTPIIIVVSHSYTTPDVMSYSQLPAYGALSPYMTFHDYGGVPNGHLDFPWEMRCYTGAKRCFDESKDFMPRHMRKKMLQITSNKTLYGEQTIYWEPKNSAKRAGCSQSRKDSCGILWCYGDH